MTRATVLVPTHDHAALLPFAVQSALDQEDADVELFVIGDGVRDDTRQAIEPFLADPRVRFFDFPKGERHGERHRHAALAEASGTIVCYLSDDDILLPRHVLEMARLLADADFAHSVPNFVDEQGELHVVPYDLSRPEFRSLIMAGRNHVSLTGAAHTLAAYRRLPHGWRAAPPGVTTDKYMWQQWISQPWFRGVTGSLVTHLHFQDNMFRRLGTRERAAFVAAQLEESRRPGFADELAARVTVAERRAAENAVIELAETQALLAAIRQTRTWRLRDSLLRVRPLRALLARSRGAR